MTIRDAINQAAKRLETAGVDEARQDAWLLLSHVRRQDRATLLAHARDDLNRDDQLFFEQLVSRRAEREPLAQIIGKKEFWSLEFTVTKDVLCPRPDSESLIEAALVEVDDRGRRAGGDLHILDLGAGSGCLLLSLLSELQSASGVGVDISKAALAVARSNAERLGLANRVRWLCADWGSALDGRFDVILCNPPYIATRARRTLAPEILKFEPEHALFAGQDGLDAYRHLAKDLRHLLAAEGFASIEVGFDQADAVANLLEQYQLRSIGIRRDLGDHDRCLLVGHA